MKTFGVLAILCFCLSQFAYAQDAAMDAMFKRAEVINKDYLKSVKPIFQKSCFDCHSNQTHYPWYHAVPGIRQYLDHDIADAKKHLDMSDDFPFEGHGSAVEDLKAISDSINKNEMPPFKYWILHSGARLTRDEKTAVNDWVKKSLEILHDQNKK